MKKLAALLFALVICAVASAGTWPTKPVRLIVPAPPGSSLDVIARILSDKLRLSWKQPVIVENKAGAGGLIAMDMVAKAAPDGTTLGIGFNGPIAFGPFLYKKMPYEPARDLIPVVLTTSQPNVLAVSAENPANTLPEFTAWARQQGDKFSYASVGLGSSSHLTMELFRKQAGLRGVHVPYAGSPPAGLSVAAGETQALFTVEPALLPLIQGRRIKLIAVTSAKRSPRMKELPTVAEAGYPGFKSLAWNGFFTAAGTPRDLVDRINADVNAVLEDPTVRDALAQQGLEVGGGSPSQFKDFIARERLKWRTIIEEAGIRFEQ